MEKELYKSRSFSACIQAALNLFVGNFKEVIQQTWLPALLYMLCWAGQITLILCNLPSYIFVSRVNSTPQNAIVSLLSLVSLILMIWLYARIFNLLNGYGFNKNLNRILKLIVAYIVFCIALGIVLTVFIIAFSVTAAMNNTPSVGIFYKMIIYILIFFIIFAILILPLFYFVMKYMMDDKVHIRKHFFGIMKCGYRHYGFIFATIFFAQLIYLLALTIVASPLIMLASPAIQSAIGVAGGDPADLPNDFPYLGYLASFIVGCVSILGNIWFYMVIYYMYGSIEAREKARNRQKVLAESIKDEGEERI